MYLFKKIRNAIESYNFRAYERAGEFVQHNRIKKKNKIKYPSLFVALINSLLFIKNIRKGKIIILSDAASRVQHEGVWYDQVFDTLLRDDDFEISHDDVLILEMIIPGLNYNKINSFGKNNIIPGLWVYIISFIYKIILTHHVKLSSHIKMRIDVEYEKSSHQLEYILFKANVINGVSRQLAIDWIFNLLQPQGVIVKSSYSLTSTCSLMYAKKIGLYSAEVQHSHIYSAHSGYKITSFYNDCMTEIIPNDFFIFSDFYEHILRKLGWVCNFKIIGNPYYTHYKTINNGNSAINKYEFLFISQYTCMEHICSWIKENIPLESNLAIKCHPRSNIEYEYYKRELKVFSNLSLLTGGSVFESIVCSDKIFGVYSSGLIDALSCNPMTFVIDVPGADKMEDLISIGAIRKIKSLSDLK